METKYFSKVKLNDMNCASDVHGNVCMCTYPLRALPIFA